MKAAQICHHFRSLLPEIFKNTPEAADYIKAAHYKDNTLTVNVANSGWAQEVIIRKPKIIEAMNKKAGKEVIKKLQTQLGPSGQCGDVTKI